MKIPTEDPAAARATLQEFRKNPLGDNLYLSKIILIYHNLSYAHFDNTMNGWNKFLHIAYLSTFLMLFQLLNPNILSRHTLKLKQEQLYTTCTLKKQLFWLDYMQYTTISD